MLFHPRLIGVLLFFSAIGMRAEPAGMWPEVGARTERYSCQPARDYDSVTTGEINALAARFLTANNLFQFTIKPEYQRP